MFRSFIRHSSVWFAAVSQAPCLGLRWWGRCRCGHRWWLHIYFPTQLLQVENLRRGLVLLGFSTYGLDQVQLGRATRDACGSGCSGAEAMADVRVTPRFVHGLHLVHVNLDAVQYRCHQASTIYAITCTSWTVHRLHVPASCSESGKVMRLHFVHALPCVQVDCSASLSVRQRLSAPTRTLPASTSSRDQTAAICRPRIVAAKRQFWTQCLALSWVALQTIFLPVCCQDTGEPLRVFSGFASPNHHLSPRAIQAFSHCNRKQQVKSIFYNQLA